MTRFEIGYRLHRDVELTGRFSTPYVEIGAFESLAEANAAVQSMINDGFGSLAEMRIVEHRNYDKAL